MLLEKGRHTNPPLKYLRRREATASEDAGQNRASARGGAGQNRASAWGRAGRGLIKVHEKDTCFLTVIREATTAQDRETLFSE